MKDYWTLISAALGAWVMMILLWAWAYYKWKQADARARHLQARWDKFRSNTFDLCEVSTWTTVTDRFHVKKADIEEIIYLVAPNHRAAKQWLHDHGDTRAVIHTMIESDDTIGLGPRYHTDLIQTVVYLSSWWIGKTANFKSRVRRMAREVRMAEAERRNRKTSTHIQPDLCSHQ